MRGAVFAYHAQNCGGFEYRDNDHIALAADLQQVQACGLPVLPLHAVAAALAGREAAPLPPRFVAFSADDGTLLDWIDYEHPVYGMQRGFAGIFRERFPDWKSADGALLTAFVIASDEARLAIDLSYRLALSPHDWWRDAAREGLVAIENHSWDHLHPELPAQLSGDRVAGDFYSVNTREQADFQIRQAREYIDAQLGGTGHRTSLFAYPYGHANDYLRKEYFPGNIAEHGVLAAFTTEQALVDDRCDPYAIPRLVCGDAWQSPTQFAGIIDRILAD